MLHHRRFVDRDARQDGGGAGSLRPHRRRGLGRRRSGTHRRSRRARAAADARRCGGRGRCLGRAGACRRPADRRHRAASDQGGRPHRAEQGRHRRRRAGHAHVAVGAYRRAGARGAPREGAARSAVRVGASRRRRRRARRFVPELVLRMGRAGRPRDAPGDAARCERRAARQGHRAFRRRAADALHRPHGRPPHRCQRGRAVDRNRIAAGDAGSETHATLEPPSPVFREGVGVIADAV